MFLTQELEHSKKYSDLLYYLQLVKDLKFGTQYFHLLIIYIINRVVRRNSLKSLPANCGLELLGHGQFHEVLAVGDHDVHLTRLARDNVDAETFLTYEHLATVCLLHRNSWS